MVCAAQGLPSGFGPPLASLAVAIARPCASFVTHGHHQPWPRPRSKKFDGAIPRRKGSTASIVSSGEKGVAPWRRPGIGTGGGHHVNLISVVIADRGANPYPLTSALPPGIGLWPFGAACEAKRLGIFPRKGSKRSILRAPACTTAREAGDGV